MPDVVRIEPAEILPKDGKVAFSPLQRLGINGAVAIGSVGGAVILVVLGHWFWVAPQVPIMPPNADINSAKVILENYKQLREAALDDTLRILDAFVVKLLLPLFTSFVGYVFGSQSRDK